MRVDEKNEPKVLFVTPYAGHSGSEVALISLINLIAEQLTFKLMLGSFYAGGLLKKVNKKVKIYTLPQFLRTHRIYNLIQRLLGHQKNTVAQSFLSYLLTQHKPDLVVVNTIMLAEVFGVLELKRIPFVVYVHELEQVHSLLRENDLQRLIKEPTGFIVNSLETRKLYKNLGRADIEVVYPGIDFNSIVVKKSKEEIRNELGIPIHAQLWCMSGGLDDNKNPLLFLAIALEYLKEFPESYFIWIGGRLDSEIGREVLGKVDEYGLAGKVFFVGQITQGYYDFLNCIDGFLLTSRRESFSLVTLEALFFGKYVIANDCGGVNEILNNIELGVTVNGSVESFVDVMKMCDFRSQKIDISDYRKNRALQFDLSITSRKFFEVINSFVN